MADEKTQQMVTVGVRMPPDLKEEVEAASRAEGFTNSNEWIRVALRRETRRVLEAAPAPAEPVSR